MFPRTRPDFLQLSASAAAAVTLARSSPLWGEAVALPGPVITWITSDTQKFVAVEAPKWTVAVSKESESIYIDPTTLYQEILGLGGETAALFNELFGPDGLRFSMGRACIGSSDYTTSVYSFDDSPEPDPELKRFSIEHARAYILLSLRMARELKPDIFLFSAPWSPPVWMKPNRSMLGGSLEREYFDSCAEYFVRFLQSYATEGVKINATAVQHEVDTNQNSLIPACLWSRKMSRGASRTIWVLPWSALPSTPRSGYSTTTITCGAECLTN